MNKNDKKTHRGGLAPRSDKHRIGKRKVDTPRASVHPAFVVGKTAFGGCPCVIWASLVDDRSSLPDEFPTEEEQNAERERLFGILSELVKWENSNNKEILDAAKAEIMKSTGGNPPALLDPFAGGGAIPLEAQRLGLEAHASDLNPVAVMINKAMTEISPKFAGQPPINPEAKL